jgi:phosphatidylserine/phosphatidylglycerophosphate/cardiolipin synthase-like enzyme
MKLKRSSIAVAIASVLATSAAHAGLFDGLRGSVGNDGGLHAASASTCAPEIGFSPEGSAAQLVDRALDSAQHSIRLAGYSFTSADVVRRLVAARHRGVDVAVIVDEKNNLIEDRSGKARIALNALVSAGIPTRTVSVFFEHHDKYFIVDGYSIESGSFNFSEAAARRNSENALVLWHCPGVAKAYLDHWQSRWAQGVDYRPNS